MSARFDIHEVRWTPETVRRFWSYFANCPHGDRAYFSSFFGEKITALARQYVPLSVGRVLDYGCGQGFMIERLLHSGIRVEGLEFSAESVENVRKRCGNHPLFGGITLSDRLPSPIESASVDVVFLIEVLEHLLPEQVGVTLEDVRRVLKVGGYLVLTTPHNEDLDRVKTVCPDCGCVFHPWQHVSSFTKASLSHLLRKHGIEVVVCKATNFERRWPGTALRFFRKLVIGSEIDGTEPHLAYIGKKNT